jgi:hypothetical protein
MVKTLLEKVGGLNLNGGPISKEQYATYIQNKMGYQENQSLHADYDCIDCGDCDCDDCPV